MRAARVGDSPPGHRTGWVDLSRLPERSDGFVVVERVEEFQPLVEIALGFGRGGRHRTAPRAEPVEERLADLRVGGGRRLGLLLPDRSARPTTKFAVAISARQTLDTWWELRLSGIELAFRR